MTTKQKQHLLAYLGYYTGAIDGGYGPQTQAATEAFQRDYSLTADGKFGTDTEKRIREVIATGEEPKHPEDITGTFWDDIRYFDREEFRCKCGGKYCNGFPAEPDQTLVELVDDIRHTAGRPGHRSSGLRCKVWNQKNNGASQSQHMTGLACDLGAPEGVTPEKMASVAEEVIGNTGGIGIYRWGIHIDSRSVKARWKG